MKKLVAAVIACLALAACGTAGSGLAGTEKEVFPVVEKYLENAASGNWNEVFKTLSGEALAEAKANAGRVKTSEKIIIKNYYLTPVCPGIVKVTADFTKKSGSDFDRAAYDFCLTRTGDQWLIYRMSYGEYIRNPLSTGQLPSAAADAINKYFEISFKEKYATGYKYLAGKALQDLKKAALLPLDPNTAKEQEKIITRVDNVECMGISDGYAIAKVNYRMVKDKNTYQAEAIVDMVDVNGIWKICNVNVVNTKYTTI